ncbi:hypothetical protein QE369_004457 [Agrobacterium larrymoorei]|uniref:Uncharacterized protein n=1 Tax=Agrobacterium larrymoorei TaxID=160699 RepID=A0AAJ2ETK1_9HYPH|nr:hypothetical protein [Agrobacterium larrymoorei]
MCYGSASRRKAQLSGKVAQYPLVGFGSGMCEALHRRAMAIGAADNA